MTRKVEPLLWRIEEVHRKLDIALMSIEPDPAFFRELVYEARLLTHALREDILCGHYDSVPVYRRPTWVFSIHRHIRATKNWVRGVLKYWSQA